MRLHLNNVIKKSAALTALLLSILSLVLSAPKQFIQVQVDQDRCKISSDSFDLQWKHSVEKTTWLEHYQIKQRKFVLRYTDLISFGAGTPTHYPIIFQKNGWIRMDVNQTLKDINWTISKNMQGTIKSQQKQWLIYQDYPDYSIVNISIQQQPFWNVIWLGECL